MAFTPARICSVIGKFQAFRSENVFVLKYINSIGTEILLPFKVNNPVIFKDLQLLKADDIIEVTFEFDKLPTNSVCMVATSFDNLFIREEEE